MENLTISSFPIRDRVWAVVSPLLSVALSYAVVFFAIEYITLPEWFTSLLMLFSSCLAISVYWYVKSNKLIAVLFSGLQVCIIALLCYLGIDQNVDFGHVCLSFGAAIVTGGISYILFSQAYVISRKWSMRSKDLDIFVRIKVWANHIAIVLISVWGLFCGYAHFFNIPYQNYWFAYCAALAFGTSWGISSYFLIQGSPESWKTGMQFLLVAIGNVLGVWVFAFRLGLDSQTGIIIGLGCALFTGIGLSVLIVLFNVCRTKKYWP